jgi:hypothetical protein
VSGAAGAFDGVGDRVGGGLFELWQDADERFSVVWTRAWPRSSLTTLLVVPAARA